MGTSSWLTCDDFAPHVGEAFTATGPDGTLALSLVEAVERPEEGGPGPGGLPRRQFAVVFLGPHEAALEQGVVTITHPTIGDLALFLVPISHDPDGLRYEATFA